MKKIFKWTDKKIFFFSADNSYQTLVIRTCALDSGTLTADTGDNFFFEEHSLTISGYARCTGLLELDEFCHKVIWR